MAIESNLAGVARVAFEAETGEFNRDVTRAETRYKQATSGMSDSAIRLQLAQDRLQRSLAKGPSQWRTIARAELAVRREQDLLTRSTNTSTAALDRQERSLGRMTRGAVVGSGALGRFGRMVSFASASFLGGAGLAYAFANTLKVAGDFERSLSILQTVTGATEKEMAAASETAKRLGRDTTLPATSAKDAATAMTELAKAGLDVQTAMAGTQGVLRLAAAAGLEVTEAATITARALNAFGLAGNDAAKVADVFAATANAASGEIPDVALAMQQASNVASSWGLTLEQTAAMLGLLANKSIIGSDAGTSLRVMLTRLIPTSKAAADKMEELGLSATDSAGYIKPLRQIMREYHDVLIDLAPAEQKLAVQMIFGQDAQRAVYATMLGGIPAYDRMLEKVTELDAAQKNAAARNEGYAGALDAFKSSVETLQITLGQQLTPAFEKALRAAADFVNEMEEDGTAVEELKTGIHDAAVALGILKEAFVIIKDAISPVVDAVGGLTRALELMFGAYLIKKIVTRFGLLGAASSTAATKGVADAARFGTAWDIATRQRNLVVTTPGMPGVPGMPGPTGPTTQRPTTRGRTARDRINQYGKPPTQPAGPRQIPGGAFGLPGLILGSIALTQSGEQGQAALAYDPVSNTFHYVVNGRRAGEVPESYVRRYDPALLRRAQRIRSAKPEDIVAPGEGRQPAPPITRRPKRRRPPVVKPGGGLTAMQQAEIASAGATTPGAELAAERTILALYERQLENTTLTGDKLYELKLKVAQQRSRVRGIEESIAADAKADEDRRIATAKRRASEKKRRRAARLAAQEQELRNEFDEALGTPGRRDDRRTFIALRNLLTARMKDPRLDKGEQQAARKRLNKLRKEWVAENEKANEQELDDQEQVLQNDILAAELTEKNVKDDLKAHRALRDLYKKRERGALTKAERQEYRGKRLKEQQEINELLRPDKSETTTAQAFLEEARRIINDFAGNVVTGIQPGTVAATGGRGAQTIVVNQNFKAPTADRMREARMARLAAEAQFLG